MAPVLTPLAQQLFGRLQELPQVEAIALGGSRATGNGDARSDFDVYLYCTEPIDEKKRQTILSQYCSVIEIGNHYWELEDNCTFQDGIDLDLLYRDIDSFQEDISRVVDDHMPSNGYTTCMWHNLRTSQIIFDRNNRLHELQNRYNVAYPDELRDAIITRNRKLLHGTLPSYDAQIHKAASRSDLVSINHRVAAFLESYFDIIFALNRLTHPGEKRQLTLALRDCTILPQDFESSLNAIFAVMFSDPEALNEAIATAVDNLERCLENEDK